MTINENENPIQQPGAPKESMMEKPETIEPTAAHPAAPSNDPAPAVESSPEQSAAVDAPASVAPEQPASVASTPVASAEPVAVAEAQTPAQPYGAASVPPVPPVPPVQQQSTSASAPVPPTSVPDSGKPSKGAVAGMVVAGALVVALGGWLVASTLNSASSHFPSHTETVTSIIDNGDRNSKFDVENQDLDRNLANVVAEEAMPSIVTIYTYQNPQSSGSGYDYQAIMEYLMNGGTLEELANGDEDVYVDGVDESVMTGLGSGVIIRDDGYIVTNNHVVEGADKLMVNVGEQSYEGTIVGTDPESDLAVVKIDAGDDKLTAIEVADSSKLEVGDWVMAIGAPLGYEQSATTGIVSALGRNTVMDNENGSTTVYAEMIQTDAAINSGNSGGALVDDEARLIGINTLVAASDYGTQADNLGFAIPSNYAIAIADQIIDNGGVVSHAKLGVAVTDDENGEGAVVSEVTAGSAADEAGIREGDVIVRVNGNKVASAEDVVYAVRASQPGDEMAIIVSRDGQDEEIDVVLGGEEAETAVAEENDSQSDNSYPAHPGEAPLTNNNDRGHDGSGAFGFRGGNR